MQRKAQTFAAVAVLAVATLLSPASPASAVTQAATLKASDAAANNRFGNSVAISEDGLTALVGNQAKPSAPSTAYVFTKSGTTWSQTAMLAASDGASIGSRVALSATGNTAIVSAPGKTVGTLAGVGAVYVFTRSGTTWSQTAMLTPPTPTASMGFGSSVSVSDGGTVLAVGAPTFTNATGSFVGAAFFYKFNGTSWALTTSLTGNSASAMFGMGVAVAGNGATIAVGQPYYKYVTDRTYYYPNVTTYTSANAGTTWSYQKTLSTPAGAKTKGDEFGGAVSLSNSGTTLIVGAKYASYVGTNTVAGAAYAYTYAAGAWAVPAALTMLATSNRFLGYSVSSSPDGNNVVVGMPKGSESGAAGGGAAIEWVRSGSTWSSTKTYSSAGAGAGDYFGDAVALDAGAGHPLIGANSATAAGFLSAGAAYTY